MDFDNFDDDRRSFERKPFKIEAHLTPLWAEADDYIEDPEEAIEAVLDNMSAGGGLFEFTDHLSNSTYYLIRLNSPEGTLPRLLLGQIKWSNITKDDSPNSCGVEFIVEEELTLDAVRDQVKKIAPQALNFDAILQAKLDKFLKNLSDDICQ